MLADALAQHKEDFQDYVKRRMLRGSNCVKIFWQPRQQFHDDELAALRKQNSMGDYGC